MGFHEFLQVFHGFLWVFSQKGQELCSKSGENKENVDKCVRFYANGLISFEDTLFAALRSIIYRFSFENL